MEVCGSHSFAIAKAGIRHLLPASVQLLSGPGCPVCVSGEDFISRAILLVRAGVRVAVFGDLMKIPSPLGTLGAEKGLLVIYSPEEVLHYAAAHPEEEVVFAAVGFEPTLSAVSVLLDQAAEMNLKNFSLLCDFKNILPVLNLLCQDPETALDGFLLPGHVAAVIGSDAFRGLPVPGVIAGFSPENILSALALLLKSVVDGSKDVWNHYPSAVRREGNSDAMAMISRYFEPCAGEWRGIGMVSGGNWKIREEFQAYDAMIRYPEIQGEMPQRKETGCRCGDVLKGKLRPEDCPMYGKTCDPTHPVGACMVSLEGACAAAWHNREVVHG
jgi:hydrogenase expression/formation protein HypD